MGIHGRLECTHLERAKAGGGRESGLRKNVHRDSLLQTLTNAFADSGGLRRIFPVDSQESALPNKRADYRPRGGFAFGYETEVKRTHCAYNHRVKVAGMVRDQKEGPAVFIDPSFRLFQIVPTFNFRF
jgi:hypothetical protein